MIPRRAAIGALAILSLALSAGIASASTPEAADFGLTTAANASGQDVPAGVDGGLAEQGTEATGHGATVSEAARAETPEGYDNHGDYVSSIARGWGEQISGHAPANN
jgi:hypothetical protein